MITFCDINVKVSANDKVSASAVISFDIPTLHLKYLLLLDNVVFQENRQVSMSLNFVPLYFPSPDSITNILQICTLKF